MLSFFKASLSYLELKIREGFEKYFPVGSMWELLRTLYGTIQAATQFWKELLAAFRSMGFAKSRADSLFTTNGLQEDQFFGCHG